MSHVSTSDWRISDTAADLNALAQACQALGLELKLNQNTYRWYGRWVNDYSASDAAYHHGIKPEDYGKCAHAIGLAGRGNSTYEIGLVRMPDGKLAPVIDHYSGGPGVKELLDKVGGKDFGTLMGLTAQYKVAAQVAAQAGHTIKKIEQIPGTKKTRIIIGVRQTPRL